MGLTGFELSFFCAERLFIPAFENPLHVKVVSRVTPRYMPKMTLLPFLQICLTLLTGRLMSAIYQVLLVCLPSSVTMWRHFSPRLDKLLPLAALYFCPVRLPTESRISTSGASEGGAHESDAPESMTVVIFLHPLLVSVLHHLSDTRRCMSISTGSAINGFRDDLMGVIGTSTPGMTFKIFFLLPIPKLIMCGGWAAARQLLLQTWRSLQITCFKIEHGG